MINLVVIDFFTKKFGTVVIITEVHNKVGIGDTL